jgi:hypothetical protein
MDFLELFYPEIKKFKLFGFILHYFQDFHWLFLQIYEVQKLMFVL